MSATSAEECCGQRVEAQLTLPVLDVHAVQAENVEVRVESERTMRALHHRHGARQRSVHAPESKQRLGPALQTATAPRQTRNASAATRQATTFQPV
jgi:hypothetical protein